MRMVSSAAVHVRHVTGKAEMGRIEVRDFLGHSGKVEPGAQAYIVDMKDNQSRIDPHFHDTDQFQVVLRGSGVIGMKAIKPFDFHYADAFSGYGPIIAHEKGLAYFTIRINTGSGFWEIPKNPSKRGRNFTATFKVDEKPAPGAISRDVLRSRDEDGLAVVGLRLGANARAAPENTDNGGQIVLVCTGTLVVDGQTLGPESIVEVSPSEQVADWVAGPEGVALLIMQFPKPSDRPGSRGADLTKVTGYQLQEGTAVN